MKSIQALHICVGLTLLMAACCAKAEVAAVNPANTIVESKQYVSIGNFLPENHWELTDIRVDTLGTNAIFNQTSFDIFRDMNEEAIVEGFYPYSPNATLTARRMINLMESQLADKQDGEACRLYQPTTIKQTKEYIIERINIFSCKTDAIVKVIYIKAFNGQDGVYFIQYSASYLTVELAQINHIIQLIDDAQLMFTNDKQWLYHVTLNLKDLE